MRVDRVSLVADVDATMTLSQVEADLAKDGLTLDVSPEASRAFTVAEWLAAGAPGARDPFRDPADHLVSGIEARLSGGQTLTVRPGPRRAVGPDLIALFVGMRGRYGTIARAHLRVHLAGVRRPEAPPFTREEPADPSEGERALLDAIAHELTRGP